MSEREPQGAIILAGGDSKRLGQFKPLLKLGDTSLIKRAVSNLSPFFDEITVITDRPELFCELPVKLTGDLLTDLPKSPLRGIHAGLSASQLPCQFVMACDMPFVDLELIKFMATLTPGYDAVVPQRGEYLQPLHAFYSRSCLEPIRRQLEEGRGKVTGFYERIRVRYVGPEEISNYDTTQKTFFNINTWEDYKEAERYL